MSFFSTNLLHNRHIANRITSTVIGAGFCLNVHLFIHYYLFLLMAVYTSVVVTGQVRWLAVRILNDLLRRPRRIHQ